MFVFFYCVFFFKQKTAYEMRISDWSSDVCSSDLLFLRKRGAGDIWQSLYEFPLVETGTPVETSGLFLLEDFRKILNDRHFLVSSVSETVKHVLSHQVILARFWELEIGRAHV